ncbi:MAG: hypothetical protein LBG78_02340 [Azoarcus sp.]|nr:hypothetical protein [Azoarcus sp.]
MPIPAPLPHPALRATLSQGERVSGNPPHAVDTAPAAKPFQNARHCERSEAIQNPVRRTVWIASSLRFSQ